MPLAARPGNAVDLTIFERPYSQAPALTLLNKYYWATNGKKANIERPTSNIECECRSASAWGWCQRVRGANASSFPDVFMLVTKILISSSVSFKTLFNSSVFSIRGMRCMSFSHLWVSLNSCLSPSSVHPNPLRATAQINPRPTLSGSHIRCSMFSVRCSKKEMPLPYWTFSILFWAKLKSTALTARRASTCVSAT